MNMTNGGIIKCETLSGTLVASKLLNIMEHVMIHKKVQVKEI